MISLLLTIYFWSLSVICLLWTYAICLIIYPFVSQKTISRTYEIFTGQALLYFMTIPGIWSFQVKDRRKDKSWKTDGKDKQYVIIANHMSFIDSLVTSVVPLKKKFMIGRVFTKFPVFGWLTLNSGYVTAEKGNAELNKVAVDKSVKAIEDGSSFEIFPEGGREKKPYTLEKFKTGAYRIAHRKNIPILPITLLGTDVAMPFGAWVNFASIEIVIDEPFYVEDDDEKYKKYIEKSKNLILENISQNF